MAGRIETVAPGIFPSKLRPAANPAYLIPRPRLTVLVEASTAAPLTLVVAPAGSGKTSLLRSWAAETRMPVAWLSLDDEDRDPSRLWSGVVAALEGVAPGVGAAVGDRLQRPGELLESVSALLDDLEARDHAPSVLVIDDLHLVDETEAASASLSLFVQHVPAWLRLVVGSRRLPHLPVHRLRARGQLGEVRFPELRFSFDEAAALLARLAPELEQDVVAEVAARAGGWAASIQLAALAARSAQAQGRPYVPSRDDERTHLEDYVWHEMLDQERGDVVDVLLATAVVTRIDAALAQAVTGREDAGTLLALAEDRGLFVSRIEPSGFEVHTLVREALLAMLAERTPERIAELHARAAEWHEAHGEAVPALEHWLRAERPRDALRLLAAQAPALYDAGQESTMLRIVQELPESVATDGPDAMLEYAWCHLLVDRQRFVALVGTLRRAERDQLGVDATWSARLEVLESIAATLTGDWESSAALARSALRTLGDTWWLDPLGRFTWNMIARDVALSERWDESSYEAREVSSALSVVPDRRIALEGSLALAEALAGRPVDALRLVAGARQASEHANMTILHTEALTAEAVAHRELGDAPIALPLLARLADSRIEPAPHCQLLALLELVQVRLVEGNLDAAEEAFGRATELVDTEMPGPGARTWLGRAGASLSLAAGDLDGARGWTTQVVDPFWTAASTARVHLAAGEPGLAADALKSAEPRCPRHTVVAHLLWFRAADARLADEHLAAAVQEAAGLGLVQTVADEGPDVVDGIERLAWRVPVPWLDRLRRAVGAQAVLGAPADVIDDLTERELEVLRILPSRLTLREIADELFISINTLKFHLKVIYRKLGCTSRAEAADLARSMTSLRRPRQAPSTRRR
ncbi:LuxR C-terminal-related transcriptional regulator [Cellulomonas rhizosphaerae]|uniref:LuxR C-terminal-related transcriptional regulator n=1 Tax=Cellulomonas rhizosphaerae TaxID=2293719 RepID=UPI0010FD5263|nr:LuxR C-terminal-related transcriptional regulator [Cellulomonas rhizosphaerae]